MAQSGEFVVVKNIFPFHIDYKILVSAALIKVPSIKCEKRQITRLKNSFSKPDLPFNLLAHR